MTTYYVATTGSNSNSGSIDSPWLSFLYAAGRMKSGDTLYARAGNYSERLDVNGPFLPNGASWDAPTTIQGYPGDATRPLLRGHVTLTSQSYIVWDGINIEGESNGPSGIFHVNGSDHIWCRNAEIHHGWLQNVLTGGQPGRNVIDCRFTNIVSHDSGQAANNDPHAPHGFYISNSGGDGVGGPVLVDHCVAYNNTGGGQTQITQCYGIQVYSEVQLNDVTVSNCNVYANYNGMNIGGGDGHSVFACNIHDNKEIGIEPGYGFPSSNMRINNNTIYNNGWHGMRLALFGALTRAGIYNNTIYNNGGIYGGFGIEVGSQSDSSLLQGNIIHANASGAINDSGGATSDVTNFTQDPQFVDAANGDFHLASSSPALGAATNAFEAVLRDKDGNFRPPSPTPWDCGAYSTSASSITRPPFVPPTPPTSGRVLYELTIVGGVYSFTPVSG